MQAGTCLSGRAEASEADLWASWRSRGDGDARARLLALHLPYARVVAASYYAKRRNNEIEFDDYLQFASLALIDAANRYDPTHGVQFRTFAARRMHGEILDGIERMTEKQQQIAAQQRLMAQRRDEARGMALDRAQGADATDKVLEFVAEAGLAFALGWLLEGTGLIQPGDEAHALSTYASTEVLQLSERIKSIVKALPAQERKVIHGHYFHQRRFDDIAAEMGLSKGRISQIHRSALARLRDSLRPRGLLKSA